MSHWIHTLKIGRVLNYNALTARMPKAAFPLINQVYMRLRGRRHRATRPIPEVAIDVTVPATDDLWNGRLSKTGGHEPGVCRFLADNMNDNDVVYDVGAHYGYYPALITAVAPGAVIHGFEPAPHQLRYWYYNASVAKPRTPWITVAKYVGESEGEHMVTLDAYAARQSRPPTLIKCDVEGYEIYVVKGSKRLIEEGKTAFLMEIHPHHIRTLGSTYEAMLEAFPKDWTFKLLEDIRNDTSWAWRDGNDYADDGKQPYLYAAPKDVAAKHTFLSEG